MNGRTNVTGSTMSINLEIPLNPVTNLHSQLKTDLIELMWTDPLDKYADELGNVTDEGDQLVSQWTHSIVVRKIGSVPSGPSDGEVIATSTTRNQYQSTPYTDNTIIAGNTYCYAIYACNAAGVYSDGVFTEGYTPVAYDPILGNNSWDIIDDACTKGLEQSLWAIGDEIDITVMNEIQTCVILDFNHDDLADGSGKASITFGLKNLMSFLNPQAFQGDIFYKSTSGMRSWFDNTLYSGIEELLRTRLKQVTKTSIAIETVVTRNGNAVSSKHYLDGEATANVYVFPLGTGEIEQLTTTDNESRFFSNEGSWYPYFTSDSTRTKYVANGTTSNQPDWFLRAYENLSGDISETSRVYCWKSSGFINGAINRYTLNNFGICFGFCVGKSSV